MAHMCTSFNVGIWVCSLGMILTRHLGVLPFGITYDLALKIGGAEMCRGVGFLLLCESVSLFGDARLSAPLIWGVGCFVV